MGREDLSEIGGREGTIKIELYEKMFSKYMKYDHKACKSDAHLLLQSQAPYSPRLLYILVLSTPVKLYESNAHTPHGSHQCSTFSMSCPWQPHSISFLLNIILLFYVYGFLACLYVCAPHAFNAYRGWKQVMDPLDLELPMTVRHS